MFRKIPSKERDTTVLQELKKEFAPHVVAVDSKAKSLMDRYAKIIFTAMILLIVASFILTFFVLKPDQTNQSQNLKQEMNAIPDGLGGELSALQNLSSRAIKMSELKSEIERIISQDSLSGKDSAYLEKAIEQMQYFHNQSKEDEH